MRPGLASDRVIMGQVLLLEQGLLRDRLAAELQDLGYQVRLPEHPHWSRGLKPWDPGALDQLRHEIERFARLCGKSDPGHPHLVHPGLGAWVERQDLFHLCQQTGLTAVQSSPRSIAILSNQLMALNQASELGIPTLVVGEDPLRNARELKRVMEQEDIRFPVVLRAVKGLGEGEGLLNLRSEAELNSLLPVWTEQLESALGEPIFFVEKLVEGAREIAAPFIRFSNDQVATLPLIDLSLRSRGRSWGQICPAPWVDPAAHENILHWVEQLAAATQVVGAGEFRFLVDGPAVWMVGAQVGLTDRFRLWEAATHTEAVAWQLSAIGVGPKSATLFSQKAKAIQQMGLGLHLYAEDALMGLPTPGKVKELEFPGKCELVLGLQAGGEIGIDDSAHVGSLWVWGDDWEEVSAKGAVALKNLWIGGSLQTNDSLLGQVLKHPWVRSGSFYSHWIDDEFVPTLVVPEGWRPLAKSWVVPGVDPKTLPQYQWVDGPFSFQEKGRKGISGRLKISGTPEPVRVCICPAGENRWIARMNQFQFSVRTTVAGTSPYLGALTAGRVKALLYREGAKVKAREPIALLGSLHQLVPHSAPVEVKIIRWHVQPDEEVEVGQRLADLQKIES